MAQIALGILLVIFLLFTSTIVLATKLLFGGIAIWLLYYGYKEWQDSRKRC